MAQVRGRTGAATTLATLKGFEIVWNRCHESTRYAVDTAEATRQILRKI